MGEWRRKARDHPRIRGKDQRSPRGHGRLSGSPPHTRERLCAVCNSQKAGRITPAYAGKTRTMSHKEKSCKDHPRIRGKDLLILVKLIALLGSPPHTRERPTYFSEINCIIRITPAYAGKTIKLHIFFPPIWDHPRIRGKDIPIRNARPIVDGSPPHTRERLTMHN